MRSGYFSNWTKIYFFAYLLFVSADHSNSRAAHHKSHKSVNDSGYAYYHEPEHGKKWNYYFL